MTLRVKYQEGVAPLEFVEGEKSDWIDLAAATNVFMKKGEFRLIPLGVAMEIPEGYEAHLVPRSSTFEKYKIIQTNFVGVIDNSYCGDNDWWFFPALAIEDTNIAKGRRIAQFRIVEKMPRVSLLTVDQLGNPDRGGHGSTGN